MHILLTGAPGVGKSTLIDRLTAALDVPVGGFRTKKEAPRPDGLCPVYIHPAAEERHFGADNLAGLCAVRVAARYPEVFETLGTVYLDTPAPLIVMDELGILEKDAAAFQQKVLSLLGGDRPVLAAVKAKDTPFLSAVRSCPKARLFTVTEDNRDALFDEILPLLTAQI